ncbi:hypothetical protein SAMN04244553_3366 [Nocardia amikacinitolerans]|uniref:Uncharacterized protein n=1 Tax=Nocardia amikacinitolerans TaxID=756689 RepID=A0A285LA82_9NOCA|nr:hypothetical protein [Nocardia amikacinitolerans]SNY81868.1 hypothetical protein SAMN04244553_3366 [Nocardia amikacinitolerans]
MAAKSVPTARPSGRRRALGIACVVVVAALGFVTRPFEWPATVVVLVVAAVALGWALRPSSAAHPKTTPLRRGTAVWSGLLLAGAGWEAYAYVRQPDWSKPHDEYPTLSTLIDPAIEQGPLRFAAWLAWLAIGWWLVTR